MKIFLFFFISLFTISLSAQQADLIVQEIESSWSVSRFGSDDKYEAHVPGNIYTDLMRAGVIPDPFVGTQEKEVEWVAEEDWTYTSEYFDVNTEVLSKEQVLLKFNGLDTYANVWLNGTHILSANNYFRTWEVDVKGLLKEKNNQLQIAFRSAQNTGIAISESNQVELPGAEIRAVTRKPQFHYGWDWGPHLCGAGIHKPIEIVAYDHIRILEHRVETHIHDNGGVEVKLILLYNAKHNFKGRVYLDYSFGKLHASHSFKSGRHRLEFEFTIPNHALWWPVGYGAQPIHTFQINIGQDSPSEGPSWHQTYQGRYAARTAELVTEKDAWGESFFFQINGKPIFAKGANYIPQDIFQNRVTLSDYHKLLEDCVAANMNMLRIWGGGIYEEDRFYELCDSLGIMVWQDFMYACAMYPGDKAFIENAGIEAVEQVQRLSKHPSVVLWCGNNENAEGWERWGWQQDLSKAQIRNNNKAYRKLFKKKLPHIVDSYSDLNYWESSPRWGRGDERHRFEGDAHYWGVWHDEQPFDTLNHIVPRFMSEFGFQSFPSGKTIEYFADEESRTRNSEVMLVHEKHPRGYEIIDGYMMRTFGFIPDKFEDYTWLSQVLQAEGMQEGLLAHRRNAPYCMGTLYWQLNDCWPVASWSSIDYFGRWKPFHFIVQQSFAPEILDLYVDRDSLFLHFIQDQPERLKGQRVEWKCIWFREDGTQREVAHKSDTLDKTFSQVLFQAKISEMLEEEHPHGLLKFTLNLEGKTFESHHLLEGTALQKADILFSLTRESANRYKIKLQSPVVVKNLWLESTTEGRFSRNFIDLLPGELTEIYWTATDLNNPQITFRCLNDLLEKGN